MADFKEEFNNIKVKTQAIRLRVWSLTLVIIMALCFYVVVNVATKQSFDWIDFIFVCLIQIVSFSLYFPEGEFFGQKDKGYINNKDSYNDKASDVNENGEYAKLREFCDYEFNERKNRYLANQCGLIGITLEEFESLKTMTESEIKSLKKHEIQAKNGTRIKFFTKHQKQLLYNLVFKPIPVQKNQPETIMSAIENDGTRAIHDTSITFKTISYLKKFLVVFLIGLVFGYVGFTLRDGFGLAQFVQIFMYITTLLTTSVMAFSSGETCSKVHKSHFYLELSNFLESFNEWVKYNKSGV